MRDKNVLHKQFRLTRKEDWTNVLRNGSFLRGRLVSVKIVKSGLEKSRVGFLVRTKGRRQSVIRNKVKRRLRAAVFPLLGSIKRGFDLAVVGDERVLRAKYGELCAELSKLFKKARVISLE